MLGIAQMGIMNMLNIALNAPVCAGSFPRYRLLTAKSSREVLRVSRPWGRTTFLLPLLIFSFRFLVCFVFSLFSVCKCDHPKYVQAFDVLVLNRTFCFSRPSVILLPDCVTA